MSMRTETLIPAGQKAYSAPRCRFLETAAEASFLTSGGIGLPGIDEEQEEW